LPLGRPSASDPAGPSGPCAPRRTVPAAKSWPRSVPLRTFPLVIAFFVTWRVPRCRPAA
jgi:hypothetical protein